jgi:hypothetical protein
MLLSIDYSDEQRVLTANIAGIYTSKDTSRLIGDLKQNVSRENCKHILIDLLMAEPIFSNFEIFDRPAIYEMLGFERDYKMAVLVPKLHEDWIFYENVCNNRGFNIKIFTDKKLAEKWLLELTQ